MKKTLKRATALLAAAAISLSAVVVAPVEAEAADEAGIRAFVTRMYEVCLDREPDTDGLNDWSNSACYGTGAGCKYCVWIHFQRGISESESL